MKTHIAATVFDIQHLYIQQLVFTQIQKKKGIKN